MLNKRIYPLMLMILVLASFFRMQAVVLGISCLVIAIPMKKHFAALKVVRLFAVLLIPAVLGFINGYKNNNYLILKDMYYFTVPVMLILSGIILACRLDIKYFLKTLVFTGVITSVVVTGISIDYMGPRALLDPYAAHYAVGIVGAPGPPLALACLLLTYKFHIRLFTPFWFRLLTGVNAFGMYMFASRTYALILLCFLFLLVADRVKKVWIFPAILFLIVAFTFLPVLSFDAGASESFVGKTLHSFSELTIGDYNTDEDINTRYRGYEAFMALRGYLEGSTQDQVFGEMGKLINLRTFVRLGQDTDFQYIPVLHNGWLYILVKTGALGVICYLSLFFGIVLMNWRIYANRAAKPIVRLFAALTIGCILSLMITNYIVTAFFNMEMSILMITLGYSYLNFHSLLYKIRVARKAITYEYADMQPA
ncbi:hypothetical protein FPZ43_17215 [Mucilaginibacter pallidiroseus]|uniref:Uncharacterized protein n=1 Tax=Mucilaginibacter pallidiroseus TaxID=2599295 RepID=A0A563U1D1_9SPHI|nr:hypothetical protein [Mucilaginibacter pallidiroseus]TWR25210.1 hypothetical protein FPZ43_17215 [Mucilaginibacter pallidiroseus]